MKEDTAYTAEVVDHTLAGTVLDEPLPNRLEAFCGRCLQAEVVDSSRVPMWGPMRI